MQNIMRKYSPTIAILLIITLLFSGCSGKAWKEKYDLGIKYLEDGKYEEAIIAFTNSIEIDNKQPEVFIARGDAYMMEESFDEALVDYETVLQLDSSFTQAYINIARIYVFNERYDDAILILLEGLKNAKDLEEIKEYLIQIKNAL